MKQELSWIETTGKFSLLIWVQVIESDSSSTSLPQMAISMKLITWRLWGWD